MTDIVKELYENLSCIDSEPSEQLQTLRREAADLWEKALPVLGMEAVDELNDIQACIANEINLKWFREGFRLGAGLLLELL